MKKIFTLSLALMVAMVASANFYDFEEATANAAWKFIQSGQTNYWTIGSSSSAVNGGTKALYITSGSGYGYNIGETSVSWAYIPVTLTAGDTISFDWKCYGESSCDYCSVYLFPSGSLPKAGSTSVPSDVICLYSHLNQQSSWQHAVTAVAVTGSYNLCFMWKNDGSLGSTPIAIDNVDIGTPLTQNNVLYNLLENGSAHVIGYTDGLTGVVSIPASITHEGKTYAVTVIAYSAFSGCSGLTSITIPNSVTSIGNYAFSGCSGLTSVVWNAKNVADFSSSSYAPFYDSRSNITSFTFGDNVQHIPAYLCYYMSNLTSITIPNSVTSIGNYAFCSCSGLTSIVVDGENAIYDSRENCNAIIKTATNTLITGCKNTVIPNSVTSIGDYAFSGCSGLTSVTIPNSVTSIGNYAFRYCSGLRSVVWNAKNVADFSGSSYAPFSASRSNITSFTFGDSVQHIPAYLCYYMSNLTSITIPNSVTSIGSSAFSACSGLTSIVVEGENMTYDSRENCNAIIETATNTLIAGCKNTVIPNSVTSIGDDAFEGCSGLTSITIPESVTSIGNYAFYECSGLTSITIPESVTSIGNYAFRYCSGLRSVVWNAKNVADFSGSSYAPFSASRSNITSFTFGDSVQHIPAYLCYGMSNMTSATIPNSVTSIGNNAFSGCSGLASVIWNAKNCADFSSSSYAPFYDSRSNITSFTFGDSVQHIPAYLCYEMSNLTSATIPNSVTSIGSGAFYGCTSNKVVINNSALDIVKGSTTHGYVAYYASDVHKETETIGDFVFAKIDEKDYVVMYLGNDCQITLPANYRGGSYGIGVNLFRGNTTANSITISNAVTSIGDYAFYGCSNLNVVYIGNSVISIGTSAFYNCPNLYKVIMLPNSVPTGITSAFQSLSGRITYVGNTNYQSGYSVLGSQRVYTNLNSYFAVDGIVYALVNPSQRTCDIIDCDYSGATTEFSIGNTVVYRNVTLSIDSINSNAFRNNTKMTKMVVDGNHSLPSHMASGCSSIDTLMITSKVGNIGSNAFSNSSKIANAYYFINNIGNISSSAFEGCDKLYKLVITDSVKNIGTQAFYSCDGIAHADIYNNGEIGSEAFRNSSITGDATYYINNKGAINNYAFANCSAITTLAIDTCVGNILQYAFQGCSALENVTLKNNGMIGLQAFESSSTKNPATYIISNVGSISNYAFANCSAITALAIDTCVGNIGQYAFQKCSALKNVTLKNNGMIGLQAFESSSTKNPATYIISNVGSISNYAFANCSAITALAIDTCVGNIGQYAFQKCSALENATLQNNGTIGAYAFESSSTGNPATYIISNVGSISESTFANCTAMTNLTIDSCVTTIDQYAFQGCSALEDVTIQNNGTIGAYAFESSSTGNPATYVISNVGSISESAFANCTAMKNLTVDSSVTSIGQYAFQECSALENATIQNNGTIGASAFENCTKLQKVRFGNKVGDIYQSAFYNCVVLDSLILPNTVTALGNNAFYNCNNLAFAQLSNTLSTIGNAAFERCNSLPEVFIPKSVSSIGQGAFNQCTSLSVVGFEDGTSPLSLGRNSANKGLFYDCPLDSVYIGRELSYQKTNAYGYSPFYRSATLRSIVVSDVPAKVETNEFYGCTKLYYVHIGNGVQSIGDYAFSGCSSIDYFSFGSQVKTIGAEAFSDCVAMTRLYSDCQEPPTCGASALEDIDKWNCTLYIPDGTLAAYAGADQWMDFFFVEENSANIPITWQILYTSTDGNIVTPNATDVFGANIVSNTYEDGVGTITFDGPVTSIGYDAFYYCSSLTSITIPKSVTNIENSAFSYCSGLTSIVVDGENAIYDSRENCNAIIETATNTLIAGCQNTIIPNSVTSIGANAFYGCSTLTSITLFEGVASVGDRAFYECSSLESIRLEATTPPTLGTNAISSSPLCYIPCGTLAAYQASGWVQYVSEFIEEGCKEPIDPTWQIRYTSTDGSIVTPYATDVFGANIVSNTYEDGIGVITFDGPVTSIGERAFHGCSGLTSITIPNSVTSIGNYAFYGCSGLTSITIPECVTSIGDYAFSGCSGLTSVVWNAKKVANFSSSSYAPFYDIRSNITSFTFDDSVQHIPACLCYGMSNLTSITIPNSVTSIGDDAFRSCSGLTSISIPYGVTSIGDWAFYGCSKLKTLHVEAPIPPTLGANAFSSSPTCHIPCGTLAAYRASDWAQYVGKFSGNCPPLVVKAKVPASWENDVITVWVWTDGDGTEYPTTKDGDWYVYTHTDYTDFNIIFKSGTGWKDTNYYTTQTVDINGITENTCLEIQSTTNKAKYTIVDCDDTAPTTAIITVRSSNSTMGTVSGSGTYNIGENAVLTATPSGGYLFTTWNDGNTDNPRLVQVTEDKTYTAYFDTEFMIPKSAIVFDADVDKGNASLDVENQTPYTITKSGVTLDVTKGIIGVLNNENHYRIYKNQTLTISSTVGNIAMIEFASIANDDALYGPGGFTVDGGDYTYSGAIGIWTGDAATVTFTASSNQVRTTEIVVSCYIDPTWQILYTSTDGNIVTPNATDVFGANIVSNTYEDGVGVITFDGPVTSIGTEAFRGCSSLASITIPNSVTSIGDYAFYYCSSLTSITIPNSVTSIGDYVFRGCSSLTSVTIPNSVTSIGDAAFAACSGLTSIVVEGENMTYDSRENCNAIIETATNTLIAGCKNTVIPNSVTSIGDYAFRSCYSLTSITIPNSVTSIGVGAFEGCSGLTSITIPESVTSIGDYAFYYCSSLTSVTIGNSVTSIGERAFCICSGLTSVTIPNSVTSIGDRAFYECSSLNSITCEATTPPTLGDGAFSGLSNTIPVYVPCGSEDTYKSADGWNSFSNIQGPPADYTINVFAQDNQKGSAIVDFNNRCNGNQISATANEGYHFVQWSDGNTDNPRTIVLTQDTVLEAEFALNVYTVTATAENGTVEGAGAYAHGATVTLTATANEGYHFVQWSNGNTDNPRTIVLTQDTVLEAEFAINVYTVTATAENGTVEGAGAYAHGATVTLTATANEGYHFVQWSDGNTDNPRTVQVTGNKTYIAYFEKTIITYELNGGVTNDYGWQSKADMWEAFCADAGISVGTLDEVKAEADPFYTICTPLGSAQFQAILNNEKWDWLEAYVMEVQNADLTTPATQLVAGTYSAGWRYALAAFFLESQRTGWPKSADFSQAGKIEAFQPAWQHGFANPTNPTSDFVLNAPYREGYTFLGWYTTPDFSGEKVTTINAETTDTLYAKWQMIDPTWQILYTSTDGNIVTPNATNVFGANIVSNNYENGQGTITFDGPVTSIGDEAFAFCDGLTSITIPNSVTSIGDRAFCYCSGLTSITIPNSVTIIGVGAFEGCSGLTSITIPNSVTSIGDWAFYYCSGLTSITIPESVTSIGNYAFYSCSSLTSITIPNSVTSIGDAAFAACSGLTSIVVEGENMTYDSRENCNAIIETATNTLIAGCKNTIIPNSVTSIGVEAFASCDGLTSITIPNSVTSIGGWAFDGCSKLKTLHVEATTPPTLGEDAFNSTPTCHIPCGTLAAYRASDWAQYVSEFIEEGCAPVQQCGDNLFWEYADGVLTITGTGDMYDYAADTDVPWYDVRGSIKTINMPDEMTKIGDYAFYSCTALTSITLPEELKHIGNRAFAQDTKIAGEVVIPAGVTSIESRAFFNLTGVSQFQVLATTPPTLEDKLVFDYVKAPISVPCGYGLAYRKANIWKDLNLSTCEVLIDNLYYMPVGDNEAHIIGYDNKPAGTLTIPGSVVIGSKTRTVTTLVDSLFFDCKEISSVIFTEGLESIGERAFVRCGLTGTIILPSTLTTIGERAFSYCNNVEKYLIQAMTPPELANDVFTSSNKNALFYISCEAMADYNVATNWSSLKSRFRDACLNIYHYNTALGANGVYTTEDTLVAGIYYRRLFTPNVWETLYLPFAVDRVTVLEDGVEYDLEAWSIFSGGHYFLATPYGVENKEVVFGFTQVVDAHTPYIIQFKDEYYRDKIITFYSEESWNKLSTSFEMLSSSFEMQMAGNTTLQDQILEEPVYMLRATSNFILQNTTTTLHPFECYVMPYATSSATPTRMNVRFRGDVPTTVESVKGNESHLTYSVDGYTLTVYPQGQAFSIYSLNGALIYSCEAGKEAVDCELNSGCYLLHAGAEAHKIML